MTRRPRTNPLALATLAVLHEGDRHPYDVASTLRCWHTPDSVKLNFGTLYNVVDGLEADGFIEATATVRSGRRPERTIYRITAAGERELEEWLTDLLATPAKEYLQFEAALALIGALAPDQAADALRRRIEALDAEIVAMTARERHVLEEVGLPRLFILEGEYMRAIAQTERDFVAALLEHIEAGTLDGLGQWSDHHECGAAFPHFPAS